MKRIIAWGLLLVAAEAAMAQSPEERTRQGLDLVLAGKYEAFYTQFSAEMKKAITLEAYKAQMEQVISSLGKPASQDPPQKRQIGGAVTVTIPLHWSQTVLNFIVSWNTAGQIQGTWLTPPPVKAPPYETPSYSRPDSFSARDITVGSDEWKLPGTLTVPNGKGPWPAVVLVHGSGPNDRDESGGGVRVFRDLSEGLASHGIAVLRYDKRTKVHPRECAADPNFTMTQETVDDAVRAAELLRQQDGIDARRIFVLGHSQGGYMMPRIMQVDPHLAGVIVMAGNVRPLEELIADQFDYIYSLKGQLTDAERAQLDNIRKDPWKVLPGVSEKYRADLKDYHPVEIAAASPEPMLILQGGRDYQVTMKDFALWKAGLSRKENVTFHSYPELNHLFVAGEGKSTPAEYEKPAHVSAKAIDDIAQWIQDAAGKTAVVVKPVANLYAQPDEDTEVVSQAIYGTAASVLEERGGWLRVQTPDQYTGWMAAAEARLQKPYAAAGRVAQVAELFAHIYHEPNVAKRRPLITVPFETRLEVIAEPADNPRWIEVRLADDRAGWLQSGDVTFDTQPLTIDQDIELSKRFLGLPYTWGGSSSFGYDCSGFTQMLCRRRGARIPRDADQQAAWPGVTAVKREELQPGDLLFFGSAPDHITHTGMYIGAGQFINATTWTHPVIQICDLRDAHWDGLLVACRRVK